MSGFLRPEAVAVLEVVPVVLGMVPGRDPGCPEDDSDGSGCQHCTVVLGVALAILGFLVVPRVICL